MAYKGEFKKLWQRKYNRTMRYGNWRQLYYDRDGMCEYIREDGNRCCSAEHLEIHEVTDDISVIEYKLWCIDCHVKHEVDYNIVRRRKYMSKLSEDIAQEIAEYGGIKNWKKAFMIREKK